jgi:hypothetical protein
MLHAHGMCVVQSFVKPCAGTHLVNVLLAVAGQQLFISCLHSTGREAVRVQMRNSQMIVRCYAEACCAGAAK